MDVTTIVLTSFLYLAWFIILITLLPAIIPQSLKIRYHAINLAYIVVASLLLFIYLALIAFCSIERAVSICVCLASGWISLMGFDVLTTRKADVIQKTGNAVIVVNHQSIFDPFPFLPLWEGMASSTLIYGGSELSRYTFLRKAVATQPHTFLDRECKRTAMQTLMTSAGRFFQNNEKNKILIFPEGGRNTKMKNYTLMDFKLGAFRVAKAFNVPIIPVVISPYYFIDHQRHYFKKGKSILSVLDPIHPEDLNEAELADKVKLLMQEEFMRLKHELVDGKAISVGTTKNNNCILDRKDE